MYITPQQIALKYVLNPQGRLSKTYNMILGIFPWRLKFDGYMVTEKLLEAGIIEEQHVKRTTAGMIYQVYFKELPSQEHVEVICLGPIQKENL